MRVDLHPDALAELRSAALWYEEQRRGLGAEFIAEVSSALDRISHAPESYPTWPQVIGRTPLIRRFTLQRFPYVLAFERHENRSLVLAVAHAKRRALYWLTRTDTGR